MNRMKPAGGRTALFWGTLLLAFIFYPFFWCVIPGILLFLLPIRKRLNIVEMIGFVIAFSISFWVTSSWFTKAAGVSIQSFAYGIIILTLGLAVGFRRHLHRTEIEFNREDRIVLAILGVAALLRFVPVFLVEAPPGADMSMHTYLAHLIVRKGMIPSSFEPLLPIELSGSYALGFHYVTALTSIFSRLPVYRAGLLTSCLSHALFPLMIYILLRKFTETTEAVVMAVVASFIGRLPQDLISSGANPTVLAVDLLIIASSWLVELGGPISWFRSLIIAFILTAALLTHAIPAVGYAYVVVPVVAVVLVRRLFGDRGRGKPLLRNVVTITCFVGVLVTPYVWSMGGDLSQAEINWVRNWQRVAFLGPVRDIPFGLAERLGGSLLIPFALEKLLGSTFICITMLGLLAVICRRERKKRPFILYGILLLGMIVNVGFWVLPGSYFLYPDRLTVLLAIPMALLGTSGVSWALSRFRTTLVRVLMIIVTLLLSSWFFWHVYLLPTLRLSAVTAADLRAFQWIEEHTREGSVFLNNYGDAGLWIPGILLRPTVIIHTNPVHLEEFRRQQLLLIPDYVYIGAKEVSRMNFLKAADLESRPDLCRRVYDREGVTIFEAVDPPALRDYFWNLEEIKKRVEYNRRIMGY